MPEGRFIEFGSYGRLSAQVGYRTVTEDIHGKIFQSSAGEPIQNVQVEYVSLIYEHVRQFRSIDLDLCLCEIIGEEGEDVRVASVGGRPVNSR